MEKKRLYRSRDDVMIAGVLAGLAEYFDHDATLWRLAFVIFLILTGVMPGVLIYLLAWIVVPQKPAYTFTDVTPEPEKANEDDNA